MGEHHSSCSIDSGTKDEETRMDEVPEILARAQSDVDAMRGIVTAGFLPDAVGRDLSGALDRAHHYLRECQSIVTSSAATPYLIGLIEDGSSQIVSMMEQLRSSLGSGEDDISPIGSTIDDFLFTHGERVLAEVERIIREAPPRPEDEPPSTLDHLLSEEAEDLAAFITEQRQIGRERAYLAEIQVLRATAAGAAEDAAHSAQVAAKAAGVSGSAGEAKALSDYANKQLRAAEFFRWSTVIIIAATVVTAAVIPHPSGDDVAGAVYRVAILVGAAGLATYFGRQAAMHRRNGNWAAALRVQLETFPALAETVRDDEVRARIFESFAQRLLHSAPEHGKPSSDETMSTQSMFETILRRMPAGN